MDTLGRIAFHIAIALIAVAAAGFVMWLLEQQGWLPWLLTNTDHYGRPNRWLQKTSVVPSEQGFTGKNTNHDVWRRKRRCKRLP
jgi:hypothetical protein